MFGMASREEEEEEEEEACVSCLALLLCFRDKSLMQILPVSESRKERINASIFHVIVITGNSRLYNTHFLNGTTKLSLLQPLLLAPHVF